MIPVSRILSPLIFLSGISLFSHEETERHIYYYGHFDENFAVTDGHFGASCGGNQYAFIRADGREYTDQYLGKVRLEDGLVESVRLGQKKAACFNSRTGEVVKCEEVSLHGEGNFCYLYEVGDLRTGAERVRDAFWGAGLWIGTKASEYKKTAVTVSALAAGGLATWWKTGGMGPILDAAKNIHEACMRLPAKVGEMTGPRLQDSAVPGPGGTESPRKGSAGRQSDASDDAGENSGGASGDGDGKKGCLECSREGSGEGAAGPDGGSDGGGASGLGAMVGKAGGMVAAVLDRNGAEHALEEELRRREATEAVVEPAPSETASTPRAGRESLDMDAALAEEEAAGDDAEREAAARVLQHWLRAQADAFSETESEAGDSGSEGGGAGGGNPSEASDEEAREATGLQNPQAGGGGSPVMTSPQMVDPHTGEVLG